MTCSTTSSFTYVVTGKTVKFTSTARTYGTGCTIKEYYWTFGRSDEEFIPNPTFTFKNYNTTYDVGLKITDSDGHVRTSTKRVTTGSETTTCNTRTSIGYTIDGKVVRFAGTANMSSACSVRSWRWDFGDGGSSSSRFPTHTYPSYNHTYRVSLDVVDSSGKTIRATDNVRTGAGSTPTGFDVQISGPTGASIRVYKV